MARPKTVLVLSALEDYCNGIKANCHRNVYAYIRRYAAAIGTAQRQEILDIIAR